ncbi:transcriptional regulator [Bordetella muralis]|jgi:two-component system, OmpR family, response regulator|uniref:transcriptional regulator n=1 Tax=Bordetella muralis TaxID=1649130 RepID=UPI0039F14B23
MHTAVESIVIQDRQPRWPQLLEGLAAQGWAVRACQTTNALADLVDVRVPQVLILENGESDLRTAVGIARYAAPNAALIVLVDDADVDARIVALDAGADACCLLMSTDVRELCALGRSLSRLRTLSPDRSAREMPLWRLTHSGRVLAGPRGQHLPLTFTESAFFLRLLSSPGHRLPRERLVATSVAAGPRSRHSARSVDVMVSRLRAKAERLGVGLPLLAVRQWGYIFLADAVPDGGAFEETPKASPASYVN